MKEKTLTYRVIAFWILVGSVLLWYLLLVKTPDFKFGLDLNGGTSLTYVADLSKVNQANLEAETASSSVSSITGQKVDTAATAKLNVADSMAGLRDIIEKRVNEFGVSEAIVRTEYSTYTDENRLIVELPGVTDIDEAIKIIGDTPILEFKIVNELVDPETGATSTELVETGLNGNYLKKSIVSFDQLTNKPMVVVSFNDEGKQMFADITKNNIGKQMAIFLDGNAISSPVIQEEIPEGEATISGAFTVQEAKDLVQRLNSGALPVPITLASSQVLEATLGDQAKADGLYAGLIAFAIIAILMILWYRLPGFLATMALVIYVGIVLLLFKTIPVVLTAAGIAAFIISIGVAIDGNILIFERIKEELRKGKNLREASEDAFERAWTSIRDSNTASILVALVLFYFGSALLKGFGLVFGLGVIASMFSSMVISRYFIRAVVPADSSSKGYKIMKFLFGSGFSK